MWRLQGELREARGEQAMAQTRAREAIEEASKERVRANQAASAAGGAERARARVVELEGEVFCFVTCPQPCQTHVLFHSPGVGRSCRQIVPTTSHISTHDGTHKSMQAC